MCVAALIWYRQSSSLPIRSTRWRTILLGAKVSLNRPSSEVCSGSSNHTKPHHRTVKHRYRSMFRQFSAMLSLSLSLSIRNSNLEWRGSKLLTGERLQIRLSDSEPVPLTNWTLQVALPEKKECLLCDLRTQFESHSLLTLLKLLGISARAHHDAPDANRRSTFRPMI